MSKQLLRIGLLILAAGLTTALLMSYAPGSSVDERELDRRLNEESIDQIRTSKARTAGVFRNLTTYFAGLSRGDLGYSEFYHAPVTALIADRAPETLRELATGLSVGWILGFGLAILKRGFSVLAGLLLSVPIALLAYFCVVGGVASGLILAIVLTPRIYRFSRSLLKRSHSALHVEMARALGISEPRILLSHVLPSISPQLLSLGVVSASMAIGAIIPIETICDVNGLGRLAWQSAMTRDFSLLVNLTMLIAIATTIATAISEAVHD